MRLEIAARVAFGEGATAGGLLCRDLLRERGRLQAVEQPLEPADDLRLRDEELGLARRVTVERKRQVVELASKLRRQNLAQLGDGTRVDLAQTFASALVERRPSRFAEQ